MKDISRKLVELAKRRGYFFQSSKAYGGAAGFFTFGPQGAALKQNIEDIWRQRFTVKEGHREIDAPNIMPEPVFEASGHLEGFDDMIIECPECETSLRADHLVEDETDIEEAESFSTDEIEQVIEENSISCPNCGNELSGVEVQEFNLMFKTNIGPGSNNPGYLRPETAQGIFVEFPRLKEYARNQLPFGVTQIGRAYRNEISPRNSLLRMREFTQAELEHFIDPDEDNPDLEKVENVKLRLYPADKQGTGEMAELTAGEAVDKDVIANEWVAYYMGLAKKWYENIGVDMERFRFRQHQSGERAHYASDCWDAEVEIDGEWIEMAGFAHRGCYDLSKHGEHSNDDFTVFKEYDEPVVKEEAMVNPDMGYLGPEYGDRAGEVVEALEELTDSPEDFEGDTVEIEVEGETLEIPVEKAGFEVKEVKKTGEHIMPHVIEPSFGIDRLVYTLLAHNYDEDEIDGEERRVLRLEPEVAPTEVGVFPLMAKDGMGDKAQEVAGELRENGFSVTYDDSGNIGRRYRRQDEIGTPVCVTIDHQTLENSTVTLRGRDSTDQVRVSTENLAEKLELLLSGTDLNEL